MLISNRFWSPSFSVGTLVVAFIALLFVADAGVVALSSSDAGFYRLSLVLRSLFELAVLLYLLNNGAGVNGRRSLMVVLTLLVVFLVGATAFVVAGNSVDLMDTFVIFNKYVFILLAYPFMEVIFSKSATSLVRLCKTYECIVYINSAAMFAGLIFKIQMLRSYLETSAESRFGYKGFIYAQNEASLFYLIALFYAIYSYHTERKKALLLTVFFSGFILGTKSSIGFPVLILAVYWIVLRKSLRTKLIALGSIALLVIAFLMADIETIYQIFPVLRYSYYFYSEAGFLTALLSNRNLFVGERFMPIVDGWNMVNWLFGGTNVNTNSIEMDFHDLFLFFGSVGSIIYLFAYTRILLIKREISFSIFFVSFLFLEAGLGGHVFYSSMNVLYLCILLLAIKYGDAIRSARLQ